jgi:hypothetical protein
MNKIPELVDELKVLINEKSFVEYEDELKSLGILIDQEDFFKNHPVSIANGKQN